MADPRMIDEARATRLLAACRARGWHVATAESCTGGLVSAALTDIPGSSDVVDRGFVLTALDVTLICEKPKIGPRSAEMRAELARIAGIAPDRISVKATTSEKLGFTGREEGIAAIATATLVKP